MTSEDVPADRRPVRWSAELARSLDEDLYVRPRRGPSHQLHRLDRTLYGRGGPESEVLLPQEIWNHWVGVIRRRQRERLDTVIAITGRKGMGKSTLGLRLSRAVDDDFGLDQVVYRAADMADLFVKLRVTQAAMYDEAALGLLSTDWASYEARELVHSVTILRPKRLTLILCLPRFKRLNASFREDLVDLWIRVDSRGVATVHPAQDREGYTAYRGLGWFPDWEFNPLTYESLDDDPLFKEYTRHRWAQSMRFLKRAAQRIGERSPQGGKTAADQVGAERRFPCTVCHVTFDRRDALHRHFNTKAHLEREAKGRARRPAPGPEDPTTPRAGDTAPPPRPSS